MSLKKNTKRNSSVKIGDPGYPKHSWMNSRAHNYTKEEGMQLIETAKFEQLLKIALSHAHALKIIIVGYRISLETRLSGGGGARGKREPGTH